MPDIPYIVHEATVDRLDRTIRRLWVLCIIVFSLFVVTNGAWIIYEVSITDEVVMIKQEAESDEGDNNLFNAINGDMNYGESKTNDGN